MNLDSFIVHLKTDNIYKHISKDVEITFDSSNFELDRSLPKGKKKVMKDELAGPIMKKLLD